VVAFDIQPEVEKLTAGEEIKGSLASQFEEDKLAKSVLQADETKIEEGQILAEAFNQGIMSFHPDMIYSNIVKNYQMAENLYGEKLLRLISSYHPDALRRNIKIPEFQKELRQNIKRKIDEMKEEGVLDGEGVITDEGLFLASIVMYTEELDRIEPRGTVGEYVHKKISHYGEKQDVRDFKKGDRYKDIGIRKSIKKAIRRGHSTIESHDLVTFERGSKGQVFVIYCLDASGSMKGKKITMAKKAGIALAYKAISNNDKVGLISFGTKVKEAVAPTDDFISLLKKIVSVRASKETDFTMMLRKAVELFPPGKVTKHLVVLTDALPTVGDKPEDEALEAISFARANGITISLIGINLDSRGEKFAERLIAIGEGRLYSMRNADNVDSVVLEDYYSVK